jgi:hypothetical protein
MRHLASSRLLVRFIVTPHLPALLTLQVPFSQFLSVQCNGVSIDCRMPQPPLKPPQAVGGVRLGMMAQVMEVFMMQSRCLERVDD